MRASTEAARADRITLQQELAGLAEHDGAIDQQLAEVEAEIRRELESGAAGPPLQPPDANFPAHWGAPPAVQTRDLRELPGGYGMGSSTLAAWIDQRMAEDRSSRSLGFFRRFFG